MANGSIIWVNINNSNRGKPNSRSCPWMELNPESSGYRTQFSANGDYDGISISLGVGLVGKERIKLDSLGMGSEWMHVSCGSRNGGYTDLKFWVQYGAVAWSSLLWPGGSSFEKLKFYKQFT